MTYLEGGLHKIVPQILLVMNNISKLEEEFIGALKRSHKNEKAISARVL
jgi:hypothetical protein